MDFKDDRYRYLLVYVRSLFSPFFADGGVPLFERGSFFPCVKIFVGIGIISFMGASIYH